ncbi:MAG: hypothetical protein RIR96_956 [Bacteroidota bacterium]
MNRILLAILFFAPIVGFAQFQQGGTLNIFSEDGDKFTLILNGEKQNETPQTNVRIEELPQPYYNAKVIFEDKALAPISKNSLMITDADGKFMDVTYKIRKDKQNKPKMNYFSMIPVQENFIAPSGVYVHRFGQPFGPAVVTTQGVGVGVTRTTTTTTQSNTVGANVNVGGLNMSVSIQDPDADFGTTTHTTTTTTHHQSGGGIPRQQTTQQTRGCSGNWAMSAANFNDAKNTIDEGAFDDTKLSTAKSIVTSNCLSTDQIMQICRLFSFEENKLAFAKFAYPYATDPRNYFKINNVFSFSTSKEELNSFIQGN